MENTHYRENSDGNSSDRGNVRGGFGNPSYQNTGTRNQEYEERNDNSIRSRHHDKRSEDHMRDSSPDRNDRARHRDKQNEDHARDQSPDRSSNEQYTQGAECGTNNKSINWNQSQSQHYQGNHENSGQGYQQGYEYQFDRKRYYYRDYRGSQGQGRYGAHGNQQSSNWNYKHNKDWNQQEQYGYWDGNKQKEFQKDRRSRNRVSEDHMRDSSPDRNDRTRPKDKQYEDHARDQSPDRSSNEQYTQGAECGTNNKSINWNQSQSQHYQGNHENSGQGYQQGYEYQFDRKRDYYRDYSGSQGQGRYGAHGNQQSSNWNYKHNKDWNQQEQYGYWDGNKQKEFQKDRRSRNRDEKSDIHLSKALSFLLRHGAERQGYKLMPGGFLYVDEILQKQTNLQDYNLEDIQRIEKSNDKQRFFMEEDKETGKMKIRANQFHSLQVENLDLKPLLSHEEAPVVIHGTYHNSWEKIKLTGLSRMGRNHIHFAAGEPGENGVISGMRSSCEVMIYINLQKALEGGLKFFWSANNVILSPGNEDGVIPPAYFDIAVLRNPRQRLDFDQNVTITRVPVGGESLAQSKSKKKKKKKAKEEDEEKGEGTEKKPKKEKNEIDNSAIEYTGSLFNEKKIEGQEEDVQKVVEKKEEKIEGQEENVQRVVEKKEEKLKFYQNVTITRVPVGGESLAQSKSKKKKKKKSKEEDEEKGEGTEKKPKKEKNEIDDSAIEYTGSLFNEKKIEGQEEDVQKVVEKKEEKIEGQEENVQRVVEKKEEKLKFDQNVTITRVPVGGESLAAGESKKKEKKKGKTGGENDGGIENIFKKENNEIDDSAIEDTGSLFNEEKIEVQEEYLQRVVEKMEVNEQKAPEKWDEVAEQRAAQKKWNEDAVQVQDDEFHDAEDGSDVIDEPIVIEDAPASVSAIDYLKGQEVVVVYCDQSEDTFSKIVCAVSDKFYIFDIQKTPDIMSEGKLAEFFNSREKPEKVFHGLTSRICATFFEKFEIILDATMIFDLKMAYDIMNTKGLGNMTELKQTRYDPESVPTSSESCDVMAYLKGFQYLDKVMKKAKDYKKQLFQMVNADICKDEMKKLREQRKKELKKSNKTPTPPKE